MNETVDAATNLPAILLMWLWWAFLSYLDAATRQRPEDAEMSAIATPQADCGQGTQDERFVEILRLDPAFSLDKFLEGARRAYEVIIEAYATADIETLKPLLSAEVLAAFAEASAQRAQRGEAVELSLVGIDRVEVVSVDATDDAVEVTLCLHAQLVWVERAADGSIIGGHPSLVADMAETWTFARPVPFADNAWTLVATGG